ncbi:MAG: GNAT family N-acetyltransferase [Clostridia bacterium]|nr:GNAT family N-acetyltransferase [Clostridia bacterium]
MKEFLAGSSYIDYDSALVRQTAARLFSDTRSDMDKARTAFEFVRDEIPHSFDIQADKIAVCASDVLRFGTGICFAKANLLAALLRSQGIPTGFCYQRLTKADDDRDGWTLHGFNAIFLGGRWIYVDARGNTNGKNARFSLGVPKLAFAMRPEYGEYIIDGIYAEPEPRTMALLGCAKAIREVYDGLPDEVSTAPAIRPPRVRSAAESDRAAISRIYCLGWKVGYRGILPQEYLDALTPEMCGPRIISPENLLVCEYGGKLAGLISVGDSRMESCRGIGEVRTIYILPEFWRNGVGRELFAAGVETLREMGFTRFYLWVLRDNVRARSFYERMGMRCSGEEKIDRIGGMDAVEVRYVGEL